MFDGLPDFAAGADLRAEDLQAIVAYLRANRLSVLPGGGLIAVKHPGGQAWRADPGDRGDWYRIQSHVASNQYTVRRQLDTTGGGFSDATTSLESAWESNNVAILPNGLFVWCERVGADLKFSKGQCP